MSGTFDELKHILNGNSKMIYGNQSKKWHIIERNDRDFNTRYALSLSDVDGVSELDATLMSIRK